MSGTENDKTKSETIQVAQAGAHVCVVRVVGRGTHQNSATLKQYFERQMAADDQVRFILDMEECSAMDSTFMGVLAGTGVRLREREVGALVVINLNEHTERLLKMLGLTHILDVRMEDCRAAEGADFKNLADKEPDKLEKIRLMIEAHQTLVDVDDGNEVKFRGCLEHLNESLERAESPPK